MTLILWLVAVAGSALVLTQSSLTAPVREWLKTVENRLLAARAVFDLSRAVSVDGQWRKLSRASTWPVAFAHVLAGLTAKLISCPMCSGFWFGLSWSYAFGDSGVSLAAHGFGGSIVSAIAVALWLLLVEATSALAQWRWQSQKEDK